MTVVRQTSRVPSTHIFVLLGSDTSTGTLTTFLRPPVDLLVPLLLYYYSIVPVE